MIKFANKKIIYILYIVLYLLYILLNVGRLEIYQYISINLVFVFLSALMLFNFNKSKYFKKLNLLLILFFVLFIICRFVGMFQSLYISNQFDVSFYRNILTIILYLYLIFILKKNRKLRLDFVILVFYIIMFLIFMYIDFTSIEFLDVCMSFCSYSLSLFMDVIMIIICYYNECLKNK